MIKFLRRLTRIGAWKVKIFLKSGQTEIIWMYGNKEGMNAHLKEAKHFVITSTNTDHYNVSSTDNTFAFHDVVGYNVL